MRSFKTIFLWNFSWNNLPKNKIKYIYNSIYDTRIYEIKVQKKCYKNYRLFLRVG